MEFRFKVRAITIKNNARTNLFLTPLLSVSPQQLRCSFSLTRRTKIYDREAEKLFQVAAILTIMLGESDFQELSRTVETLERAQGRAHIHQCVCSLYNKRRRPHLMGYADCSAGICIEEISRYRTPTKNTPRMCITFECMRSNPIRVEMVTGICEKYIEREGKYELIFYL